MSSICGHDSGDNPPTGTNSASASDIPTSGTVGIVYVGQSLYPGMAPVINARYRIVKAWSMQLVPEIGCQLRRRSGDTTFLCGWIRKDDNTVIMQHLDNDRIVCGTVTELEPFWWQDAQCYWGTMDWQLYNVNGGNTSTTTNSTGGQN